jgi:hypothetical protein
LGKRGKELPDLTDQTVMWNGERRLFLEALNEACPSIRLLREILGRPLTLQEIFDAVRG